MSYSDAVAVLDDIFLFVKEFEDFTPKGAGELLDEIFDPNPDWRKRTCLSDEPMENADVFERNKMDKRVKEPNFILYMLQ